MSPMLEAAMIREAQRLLIARVIIGLIGLSILSAVGTLLYWSGPVFWWISSISPHPEQWCLADMFCLGLAVIVCEIVVGVAVPCGVALGGLFWLVLALDPPTGAQLYMAMGKVCDGE